MFGGVAVAIAVAVVVVVVVVVGGGGGATSGLWAFSRVGNKSS